MSCSKLLSDLAKCLRGLQLFYHAVHLNTRGASFHADHAFFGGAYQEAESGFDSVYERLLGVYESAPKVSEVIAGAAKIAQKADGCGSTEDMYKVACQLECVIQAGCKKIDAASDASPGVKQLVGDICEASEQRCYKIKQRMGTAKAGITVAVVVGNKG